MAYSQRRSATQLVIGRRYRIVEGSVSMYGTYQGAVDMYRQKVLMFKDVVSRKHRINSYYMNFQAGSVQVYPLISRSRRYRHKVYRRRGFIRF